MGAALVLLLVGLGALAAGVLIGRYYVPDDRQLRRTARHSRAYMRALSHLIARDFDTVANELRLVVEENIDDSEPYFALGALFRSRGEHERAIRVHQALAMRERDKRKLRQRAMYELGLDFRAAGMPRRATRAMEEVLIEDTHHDGAVRVLASLYEEQARFNEAAGLWQRIGKRRGEDTTRREHHLLVAAAQAAIGRGDLESARELLKAAQKLEPSAHFFAAAAELAAARGNHRGARERIKQALAADAGLAPHLLPALIAAEQGLAAAAHAAPAGEGDDLADAGGPADASPPPVAQLAAAPIPDARALAPEPTTEAGVASAPVVASPTPSPLGASVAPAPQASATSPMPSAREASASSALEASAASSMPSAREASASPPPAALATEAGALAPPPHAGETALVPASIAAAVASASAPPASDADRRITLIALPADAAGPDASSITDRVLAVLAEVEAQTGPRLEIALLRAQLVPPADAAAQAALAAALVAQFPTAIAARVAAARLASASDDPVAIRAALDALVAETGALAWALRGRWQCGHCGHRPAAFSWRCGQ
ncbi:MAG TPA: hypothetical protein VFP84_03535, partial [Kofleriaceae bacterium]|nr:hypothetical protein [Kofleriaceae bacterium]